MPRRRDDLASLPMILEGRMDSPITKGLARGLEHLSTIPQRALEAAGSLQRGGSYDPAPVMEAAELMMTGGIPFRVGGQVLGSGIIKPNKKLAEADVEAIFDKLKQFGGQKKPPLKERSDLEIVKALYGKVNITPAHQDLKHIIYDKVFGTKYPKVDDVQAFMESGISPHEMLLKSASKKYPHQWTAAETEAMAKAGFKAPDPKLMSPEDKMTAYEKEYFAKPKPKEAKPDWIEKHEKIRSRTADFTPWDWRGAQSEHPTSFVANIPQHAVEQGFNPNFPLFKGRQSERPTTELAMRDPATKFDKYGPQGSKTPAERALFFAEEPRVAAKYGPVQQYVARAENPAEVDWYKRSGERYYDWEPMNEIIESARKQGIDLLRVKNIADTGGYQNQILVMPPNILRRPHAGFDPTRLSENNMLAGLGGLALLPMVLPDEYQKERGQ